MANKLLINGQDIMPLLQIDNRTTHLTYSPLFRSNNKPEGKILIEGIYNTNNHAYTKADARYEYSGNDVIKGKIFYNNNPIQVAPKGCRPTFETRIAYWVGNIDTRATCFINYFDDGEVWLSSTYRSRSGVQLSTAEQQRRAFLIKMHGAGGGGGSTSGLINVQGAGGGSGGYHIACMYIDPKATECSIWFRLDSQGSPGMNGGSGGRGGDINIGYYDYLFNSSIVSDFLAPGGSGGSPSNGSGGNGGNWGNSAITRVSPWSIDENNNLKKSFISFQSVNRYNGVSGGSKSVMSRSSTSYYDKSYTPEEFNYQYTQGYSNDGMTGSGVASGCGGCSYLGKGGRSVGDATNGANGADGAGGSGGGAQFAYQRWGGRGGSSCIEIYV